MTISGVQLPVGVDTIDVTVTGAADCETGPFFPTIVGTVTTREAGFEVDLSSATGGQVWKAMKLLSWLLFHKHLLFVFCSADSDRLRWSG